MHAFLDRPRGAEHEDRHPRATAHLAKHVSPDMSGSPRSRTMSAGARRAEPDALRAGIAVSTVYPSCSRLPRAISGPWGRRR